MSRGARELWSPSVNLPEVAVCAAQPPCCGEILSFTRTGSDVADTENPSGSPMARRLTSTRHVMKQRGFQSQTKDLRVFSRANCVGWCIQTFIKRVCFLSKSETPAGMLSFVDCKCCRLGCQRAAVQRIWACSGAMKPLGQNFILPTMTIVFGLCQLGPLPARVLSSGPVLPSFPGRCSWSLEKSPPSFQTWGLFGFMDELLLDRWEPACNHRTAMKPWRYSAARP